jgi:hypothetical protein
MTLRLRMHKTRADVRVFDMYLREYTVHGTGLG